MTVTRSQQRRRPLRSPTEFPSRDSSAIESSVITVFKLAASELDCAKAAIEYHGYSTLLPTPPEWSDVSKRWPAVRNYLCELDLEQYTPWRPLAIAAAKDETSVRLVHLLHPEDLLLYTSLTLIVKNDIEYSRARRTTKRRVYSYRASREDRKLYDSVRNTHQKYVDRLRRKANKKDTRAIAVTDVGDFYASISQAQLKRLLKAAARTRRTAEAASLLVSVFAGRLMTREGHGIPTGPLASRVLAEIVLDEIDKYLMSKRVDFVRWVDDYNIFEPSKSSARATVLDLASWLYSNCGLTLQAAKTHVLDRDDYAERFLVSIEDQLSDRAVVLAELFQAAHDYEMDYSPEDVEEFMDDLPAVELLEMLVLEVISGEGSVDYRAMGFVVRRLQRITLDQSIAREVLEVLVENVERLSPVIADVARLIVMLLPRHRMPKRIGDRLLRSLRRTSVDHHAVWILTIFAQRGRKVFLETLYNIYEGTKSHVIKRYAILAIVGSGGKVPRGNLAWVRMLPRDLP